jgi:hypothetical protein
MPLPQPPVVTVKSNAAHRPNARFSIGRRRETGKRRVTSNGLRHGQRPRSFCDAIATWGCDSADFDRIINADYYEPQTSLGAMQIAPMAQEDWLQREKCAIRNPFYDRPKPECAL